MAFYNYRVSAPNSQNQLLKWIGWKGMDPLQADPASEPFFLPCFTS